ncbi:MAG TPA: HDIG domain-containing protein [Nitriliruptorales bacterium]
MALTRARRAWLQRAAALVLTLAAAPLFLVAASLAGEAPIREGELAPRTVVAGETVRVVDPAATERARQQARDNVSPVLVFDDEAQAAVLRRVRDAFDAVRSAREPTTVTTPEGPRQERPTTQEQIEALRAQLTFLDDDALSDLVSLTDQALAQVDAETIGVAQELARQRIREAELDQMLDEQLRVELALRAFPGGIESSVIEPLIRAVMEPTVRVDQAETDRRKAAAANEVDDVPRTFLQNTPIVTAGQTVDPIAFQALQQVGLEGSDPVRVLLRSVGALVLVVAAVAAYLALAQRRVWRSGRAVLLLGFLVAGYAALVATIDSLSGVSTSVWWYALPAGGLGMIATILLGPGVGVTMAVPGVVLPLVMSSRAPGLAVFLLAAVFVSVPLVASLSSRGDLRSALLRAGFAFPALAVLTAAVFDGGPLAQVAGAGLVNGLLSAVLVQGLLPFLESTFRVSTVTTLLDLADRNHPLLRELEQKALGSYNHSVMVATLVERACRAIGANALLGSVAALYHDIGKVRRPHFFIENQQGIANPHDDLEPLVSARIIQEHVEDGVMMAREFKLPPDVVASIGSHHGTTIVKFFYRKALEHAEEHGDPADVHEHDFRYNGTKPRSKEASVLLIADCCEATTRSAAMAQGTLSRDEIEFIVDDLIADRVDDGQLEEAELTFAELSSVRDSVVDALVGVYHPRIAYPKATVSEETAKAVIEQAAG